MSLVGFRAQNHPQQAAKDHVDDRAVLPEYFDAWHERFQFTIDAAASASNAVLPRFWTVDDDALRKDWNRERVWCNPPYSDLAPWLSKAWREMEEEGCELVVMLLPANRTEQGWWQTFVEPFRDRQRRDVTLRVEFLPTRMRFRWPESRVVPPKGDRPPFGCCLLIWERTVGSLMRQAETPAAGPQTP